MSSNNIARLSGWFLLRLAEPRVWILQPKIIWKFQNSSICVSVTILFHTMSGDSGCQENVSTGNTENRLQTIYDNNTVHSIFHSLVKTTINTQLLRCLVFIHRMCSQWFSHSNTDPDQHVSGIAQWVVFWLVNFPWHALWRAVDGELLGGKPSAVCQPTRPTQLSHSSNSWELSLYYQLIVFAIVGLFVNILRLTYINKRLL